MSISAAEAQEIDAVLLGLDWRAKALLLRRAEGKPRESEDGGSIVKLRDHECVTGWLINDFGRKVAARVKMLADAKAARRERRHGQVRDNEGPAHRPESAVAIAASFGQAWPPGLPQTRGPR